MDNFTFDESTVIKQLNAEDALTSGSGYYPSTGSYIDVSNYERFGFLFMAGASGSDLGLQVMQSTSSGSSGQKVITNADASVTASTGADKWYYIEVQTDHLDINNDFDHVTLRTTGAGSSTNYGAILFLGHNPGKMPVTQGSDEGESVFVGG